MSQTHRMVSSGAALQEALLREVTAASLVVVPHQRLARQVWRRQRERRLRQGRAAWEPLPLMTLEAWWARLLDAAWAPVAPAPPLVRLALWQEAMEAAPPLAGLVPDLSWAAALDEAYRLLARHLLLDDVWPAPDSPFLAWRQEAFAVFAALAQEQQWLPPGQTPGYLRQLLAAGRLPLPESVWVVGLEHPAPAEQAWLADLARVAPVQEVRVRGDGGNVQDAVALPDPRQEQEWVAAQLVHAAADGIPLHRLAVTSPRMDQDAPQFRRVLAELLGAPATDRGMAYNFSQGPRLGDTPLAHSGLLPLVCAVRGERREHVAELLLSPYYAAFRPVRLPLAQADRRWREERREAGWPRLRPALAAALAQHGSGRDLVAHLDQVFASLGAGRVPGREWLARLRQAWRLLGFPGELGEEERPWYGALKDLLEELEAAIGRKTMDAGDFLAWLRHGAANALTAGAGSEEAGIQVLGFMEMRGLDFDRVYCLGLNAGVFPPGPRMVPLLSPRENALLVGGTHDSQHRFARDLFDTLLGAAPHLVLTRSQVMEEEEQVPSPLWLGDWRPDACAPLSHPPPAWAGAPAVQALLTAASAAAAPEEPPAPLPAPVELPITKAATALACPCRYLLEGRLEIHPLPEIEPGLPPLDRGDRLHRVLAEFVTEYQQVLAESGAWDDDRAWEMLTAAASRALAGLPADPHWQAEYQRWLGDDAGTPGVLRVWLAEERRRFTEGWRWDRAEEAFTGLTLPGCPFTLRGRIDRMDCDPAGSLVLWDYKTGGIPSAQAVFTDQTEFQLAGYLLAARHGALALPDHLGAPRAGYIALKSTRRDHLKFEAYSRHADDWPLVLDAWMERLAELGQRLTAGDYRPAPRPADRKKGPCAFCPFAVVCGYWWDKAGWTENAGEEAEA